MELTTFLEKYQPLLKGLSDAWSSLDHGYTASIGWCDMVDNARRPHAYLSFCGPGPKYCPVFLFYTEENGAQCVSGDGQPTAYTSLEQGLQVAADFVGEELRECEKRLIDAKELHTRVCDELPTLTA